MADRALDHFDGLVEIAALVGPPIAEIVQRIGVTRVDFDGAKQMCLRGPRLAEPFQRHAEASVKSAGVTSQRHRGHVGIPALPEHAFAPVGVSQPMEQIGVFRVAFRDTLHQRDGGLGVPGLFDHSAFGEAGQLPEQATIGNAFQIGQRDVRLPVIGQLLRQKKPCEMMFAVDEQREAQARGERLPRIAFVRERQCDHGPRDMLLDRGDGLCLPGQRRADFGLVELA